MNFQKLSFVPSILEDETELPILSPRASYKNDYKLPPLFAANSRVRRSTIAFNLNNSLLNDKKIRSSIFKTNDETPRDKNINNKSSIENFDDLKFKYSQNRALEHRLTIDKMNTFKRKVSIAIAKNVDDEENRNKYKQKEKQSLNFSITEEDGFGNMDKLHVGSLLSFEGQFATLACIDETIKTKIKTRLIELANHTRKSRFELKFNNKTTGYFRKVALIEKLILSLNKTNNNNNVLLQPQMNINGFQNPLRKAFISKYIDDGMRLIDESNNILKKSEKDEKDEYSDEIIDNNWYNSSLSLRNEDFEILGVGFKKIYYLIDRFNEWRSLWLKAF